MSSFSPADRKVRSKDVVLLPPVAEGVFPMSANCPKQALATREAHEALLELKRLVDEATRETHEAELESFSAAMKCGKDTSVRMRLQSIVERFKSPSFEAALTIVRDKLQAAVSA
jgi:hypothetical protein